MVNLCSMVWALILTLWNGMEWNDLKIANKKEQRDQNSFSLANHRLTKSKIEKSIVTMIFGVKFVVKI